MPMRSIMTLYEASEAIELAPCRYSIITSPNQSLVYGRRRQAVKAPGCGLGIRGFDSPRLPHIIELGSNH